MIPIIDTGHGYNTPGKRSEGFKDATGRILLKENSINEAVGNKLSLIHYLNAKEYYFISNEWYDISLQERVNREKKIAKNIFDRGTRSLFISIHADAFHTKNGAEGGRFFYFSHGGREIAVRLTDYLRSNNYDLTLRKPLKRNFKVLRDTNSPAVLFEMGFMTTKSDLDILLKDSFRNKTAKLLYEGLQNL